MESDWYKKIWTLEAKNYSWVETTEGDVDFIIKALGLTGKERILDLACGFGRHSLSLARRGFSVTGVDITKEFIEDARKEAKAHSLEAEFILADIRDLGYKNEFDVVINLSDGAIGYLENDEENLKIFDVIGNALRLGGKHFMEICSAEHAEKYLPKQSWYIGSSAVSLAEFNWDVKSRRILSKGYGIPYGQIAQKPEPFDETSVRLYSNVELENILQQRHMKIIRTYADYHGNAATDKEMRTIVCAEKQ
jgi:SAM-dependent methyltransferase